MAPKRLRRAIGTPDGAETNFAAPHAFTPGSLLVFLNGQQKDPILEDGWVETDPSNGTFAMKEAPLVGDAIWVFYEEA